MSELVHSMNRLALGIPTDYNGTVPGKSTIFTLNIKPGSIAYRYDVEIVKAPNDAQKRKELTKQTDLGMKTAQRQACAEILETLFTLTQGFGVGCKYVYDGKRILFTTAEIKMNQKSLIPGGQLPQRASMFVKQAEVEIVVTANEAAPRIDYSNLKDALVADVSLQADRSVRMFLEILTSQYLLNSAQYQQVGAGTLFEVETRELMEGMDLRVGIKKGVRIGGVEQNPQALMVIDMKRTAFFANKNLATIYNQFVKGNDNRGQRQFENFFKGVRAVVTYDRSRAIVIGRLSRNPLTSNEYSVGGKSVKDFMAQTKGIHLKFANLPGIHPDQPGGQKIVYPLEVLEVLDGQLVPLEKLTTRASQKLLTENSVKPDERYAYVMKQAQKIAGNGGAAFLNQFGVNVNLDDSVVIKQRVLPEIFVGGNAKVKPQRNGAWFRDAVEAKFIAPANRLKNWIVAYNGRSVAEKNVQNYIKSLRDIALKAGLIMPEPLAYCKAFIDELDKIFVDAQSKNIQFIFYVDEERENSHGRLKLLEAYYKILTQHVITKNLNAGPQTFKNVLMKLNTKTFGLCFLPTIDTSIKNYSLDNDDLLIIGIDLVHPQKLSPKDKFELKKKNPELNNKHPTVVGVSANKMTHRWGFAGDFFYQESKRDNIDPICLRKAVAQLTETAKKANRTPKRVIVFRDGVSEGQQQTAEREELPAIRSGIRDVYPGLDPKITFIVATKDHHKRVYRVDGNSLANTCPGDIVDSKIVRTDIPEFFQQSHNPLKGCPKMLQVSPLANELGMSMSDIQKLILMLSSMHQVSACPTSLPLPIYLADETAKRGMDIYNELYVMRNPRFRNDQPMQFAMELTCVNGIFNFGALTDKLGYAKSKLVSTRFNA